LLIIYLIIVRGNQLKKLVKDVFLTHILLVISSFMPTNRSSRNYPPRPHHQFTAPRIAVASSEKTATNPKAWRRPAAVQRQWVPQDPVGPTKSPPGLLRAPPRLLSSVSGRGFRSSLGHLSPVSPCLFDSAGTAPNRTSAPHARTVSNLGR
jgi:hypothetical protein